MTTPLETALHRALVAIDDAMQLAREHRKHEAVIIETLSRSLADPSGLEIALVILKFIPLAENDKDRDAIATIVRAVHAAGLIDGPTTARVMSDLEKSR